MAPGGPCWSFGLSGPAGMARSLEGTKNTPAHQTEKKEKYKS